MHTGSKWPCNLDLVSLVLGPVFSDSGNGNSDYDFLAPENSGTRCGVPPDIQPNCRCQIRTDFGKFLETDVVKSGQNLEKSSKRHCQELRDFKIIVVINRHIVCMFSGIFYLLVRFEPRPCRLILDRCHFPDEFLGKKIRSLSFRTKNPDSVKMGDFWQRHLG
jgi:hypothetical protein